MKTIGSELSARIDQAAADLPGVTRRVLMERAAAALARGCEGLARASRDPAAVRFHVFCGKGYNGGDGYAAAGLLQARGARVWVWDTFPGARLAEETGRFRSACLSAGIPVRPAEMFREDEAGPAEDLLLVDAVFGTGFRGEGLPDPVRTLFARWEALRRQGARIVAADLPSGVDADTGLCPPETPRAVRTITFLAVKTGLVSWPGRERAGEILSDPLGLPGDFLDDAIGASSCEAVDLALARTLLPERLPDGHKGTFGRVALAAGSPFMPGAAALAAEGALRSGCGLVHLATHPSLVPALLPRIPEVLFHPLDAAALPALLPEMSSVGVGPGLGRTLPDPLLERLLLEVRSLVLDADALNQVARSPDHLAPLLPGRAARGLPPALLLPHPGEGQRLLEAFPPVGDPAGESLASRLDIARALARRTGCVVLYKGAGSVTATPGGQVRINLSGNSGLAKGGSGDILCGLAAGLLAQGLRPHDAAALAACLHGLAADLAAARTGVRALRPVDVLAALPEAFLALEAALPQEDRIPAPEGRLS